MKSHEEIKFSLLECETNSHSFCIHAFFFFMNNQLSLELSLWCISGIRAIRVLLTPCFYLGPPHLYVLPIHVCTWVFPLMSDFCIELKMNCWPHCSVLYLVLVGTIPLPLSVIPTCSSCYFCEFLVELYIFFLS